MLLNIILYGSGFVDLSLSCLPYPMSIIIHSISIIVLIIISIKGHLEHKKIIKQLQHYQ
jgi:hypothetical protein